MRYFISDDMNPVVAKFDDNNECVQYFRYYGHSGMLLIKPDYVPETDDDLYEKCIEISEEEYNGLYKAYSDYFNINKSILDEAYTVSGLDCVNLVYIDETYHVLRDINEMNWIDRESNKAYIGAGFICYGRDDYYINHFEMDTYDGVLAEIPFEYFQRMANNAMDYHRKFFKLMTELSVDIAQKNLEFYKEQSKYYRKEEIKVCDDNETVYLSDVLHWLKMNTPEIVDRVKIGRFIISTGYKEVVSAHDYDYILLGKYLVSDSRNV